MAINEDYNLNVKARGTTQARQQIAGLGKGLGAVTTAAKAFVAALAVREIIQFGNALINVRKEFQQYYNQLRLVTAGQEELDATFQRLILGARESRTELGDYTDLFQKLRISTEQLGYSVAEVEVVTKNLSKALKISGADGNTTTSVIRQFGQAMASGTVRGDEFRSVVEGMGGALQLMALQSGLNIGELRKMSREGDLAADVFFEMFLNADILNDIFAALPKTIEDLEREARVNLKLVAEQFLELTGIAELYEKTLESSNYAMRRMTGGADYVTNMTNNQIEAFLNAGEATADYEELLYELERRLGQQVAASQYSYVQNEATIEQLRRLIEITKQRIQADKDEAESKLDQIRRTRELTSEVNSLMRPYTKYINLSKQYMEMDFGTPLEKARKKYAETEKTLKQLNEAQTKVAHGSEIHFQKYYELEEQINATKIAQQEFLKEIERLEDMEHPLANFALHIKEQGDIIKQLDSVAQRTYNKMADAITDFVMTGKFSFKDLARSIIADLVRIAAQAAITFAIKTAAAAVGIPLPFLAEGGPAKRGTPYIVGEKGPELFVPNQSGTVISNEDVGQLSAQADGGVSTTPVNISFNINTVDATSFDELLLTRRGLIASMINEGLARQGRRAIV